MANQNRVDFKSQDDGTSQRGTAVRHSGPHNAAFEGWYGRFFIPSTGASIVFVLCTVPKASIRPHMISLTYVSPEGNPIYQKELWVPRLDRRREKGGWIAEGTDPERNIVGTLTGHSNGTMSYRVESDVYQLDAHTTHQVPFRLGQPQGTPAGWMVNLPLPIQWHVHSLASRGRITLSIPEAGIRVRSDVDALVHEEKNWANSFPKAHMWLQGHNPAGSSKDTSAHFCLAGGHVYSFLDAYILTFRNSKANIWLRPPVTLSVFSWSPFLIKDIDWPARRFALTARGWRSKVIVTANAPKESFFNLSAPFREGHRAKALAQSMDAVIEVQIWRLHGLLSWLGLGSWMLSTSEIFQKSGLEFGGGYYPEGPL